MVIKFRILSSRLFSNKYFRKWTYFQNFVEIWQPRANIRYCYRYHRRWHQLCVLIKIKNYIASTICFVQFAQLHSVKFFQQSHILFGNSELYFRNFTILKFSKLNSFENYPLYGMQLPYVSRYTTLHFTVQLQNIRVWYRTKTYDMRHSPCT